MHHNAKSKHSRDDLIIEGEYPIRVGSVSPENSLRSKYTSTLSVQCHMKKCLVFGHTEKHCREIVQTCGKCNKRGHSKNHCKSLSQECQNCKNTHPSFSRNCPIFKQEQEIVKSRKIERICRSQAVFIIKKPNPNTDLNFAKAILGNQSNHQLLKAS